MAKKSARKNNGANLGFEATLWKAADKMRGQMDPSEYKHVVIGRLTKDKAILVVAAQEDGAGIGQVRMRRIPDVTKASLHAFIADSVQPGSTVRTDGLNAYLGLKEYIHDRRVQQGSQNRPNHLLPKVHLVVSLLMRWLLGTHQGAIGLEHLDYYLDEFTFRFNRRKSASRGKLFYRLIQQAL